MKLIHNVNKEDAVFVALLHAFGKLGVEDEPYYIMHPQFSTRFRNRKKKAKAFYETILYTVNENLPYMKVSELTLWLLQEQGISLPMDRYLAIKLSEGIFDENNRVYFANSFNSKEVPKLVSLLVMANWMAIIFEREEEDDKKSGEILGKLKGAL